jgi:nucleotide-binding universal stress UspA family protein
MSAAPAPVVAAYEGPAGPDVLAFARVWCRASGRPLRAVTVYPGRAPIGMGRTDLEWVAYNREETQKLLQEARGLLGDAAPGPAAEFTAEFTALPADSASRGLHDVLEAAAGTMVVAGSQKTRGVRRTAPGSTADRLLHGAPGPVRLVPWDYEQQPADPVRRVGVAFVDTLDARAALAAATGMARELGAELHLLSVLPDTRVLPALGEPRRFAAEQRAAYRESLDAAAATVPADVATSVWLLEGPVVDALADLRPDDADLLVCGSRGYGPARRVLLGGVSPRLLRHARLPVAVVPRSR